jgi:Acyl-CoA reductase (LuxC)
MSDLIQAIDTPDEITAAAKRLRERSFQKHVTASQVLEILERWGGALEGRALDVVPGVAFLRLWLRRSTLEPIVLRELGAGSLTGEWRDEGQARMRVFPLGVIGHWPAGNIEIQPLLSLSCSLLGGNSCLVRVPTGLVQETRMIMEKLKEVDHAGVLTERLFMAAFDHTRTDLQQAMAQAVDGAMIWGGGEAVTQIRALPFPHWAHLAVFGPRLSVAALDGETWGNEQERRLWCQRIARDVWQFDQEACSSPQTLFLERRADRNVDEFLTCLREAFEEENRLHLRQDIHAGLTSAICLVRASWMLDGSARRAVFPTTPDWTILLGAGATIPKPTQGRTLSVLQVDNLLEPIAHFDGMVQTLGLGLKDVAKEASLAQAAGRSGVDRIVKLGRMHVFGSPWDGVDLIRPMVRLVRHVPSQDE